jgi:hypothetical protein
MSELSASVQEWIQGKLIHDQPIEFASGPPEYGLIPGLLEQLLIDRPDLTLDELRQLDNAKALTAGVGQRFYKWATEMLAQYGQGNNTLTYFIDPGDSIPKVGKGVNPTQFDSVRTKEPGIYEDFIVSTMETYQNLSGGRLRFQRVNQDDLATISFYRGPNDIPLSGGSPGEILLGVSNDETNGKYKWRNVFYNEGSDSDSQSYKENVAKNTIVHEMGHTVGLRHPADLATDIYALILTASGKNTAYSYKDSIMSYNRDDDKKVRHFIDKLQPADEAAFLEFWSGFSGTDLVGGSPLDLQKDLVPGSTSPVGSSPRGTMSNLELGRSLDGGVSYGGSGRDIFNDDPNTDDLYIGGDGHDLVNYKGGFDFANGGEGRDLYYLDPITQYGQLTINDFTLGEDMIRLGDGVQVTVFTVGGETLLVSSDTDVVASIQGEFTREQLFDPTLHLSAPTLAYYGLQV